VHFAIVPGMDDKTGLWVCDEEATYREGTDIRTDTGIRKDTGRGTGDTHHFHLSYKDGWYDGQFGFVNEQDIGTGFGKLQSGDRTCWSRTDDNHIPIVLGQ